MLFSIIIPVYNREKTIKTAVESVLSQSCADWELLIVDDGSIDPTSDVCKKMAAEHPGIRYFF